MIDKEIAVKPISPLIKEVYDVCNRFGKTPDQIIPILRQVSGWRTLPYSATQLQRQLYAITRKMFPDRVTAIRRTVYITDFGEQLKNACGNRCEATITDGNWPDLMVCDQPEGHTLGDEPTPHSAPITFGEFYAANKHGKQRLTRRDHIRITWE